MNTRIKIGLGVIVLALAGAGVWVFATSGREKTDDAQVDAHIVPIAARVGGTVAEVPVQDNQKVEAGAVLVAKLSVGALAWGDDWFRGITRNPWHPKEGSSGSSAGSCSATSAGLVGFAIPASESMVCGNG